MKSLTGLWDYVWNYSIKRKILIFTILMIMIPILVIGLYFIHVINTILADNHYNDFVQLSDSLSADLASQVNLIENTYFIFISDPTFQENVSKLHMEDEDVYQVNEEIDNRMRNYLYFNYPWSSKLLQSIYVFIDEKTSYFYDYNHIYNNNYTYNNDVRNRSLTQILGLTWDELLAKTKVHERIHVLMPPSLEDPTIYYARDFYDLNKTAFKGLIVLGVDEAVLSQIYQSRLYNNRSIGMILNESGIIISHTHKDLLGLKVQQNILDLDQTAAFNEIRIDGEIYLASSRDIGISGLKSIIAIPKSEIFSELTNSIRHYLLLILILCALFIMIGYILSSKVTKQINVLIKKIETIHLGKYDTQMEPFKEYELGKLSRIFNDMTRHIRYLIREVYQKQLLIKEAELKSLQAQINPHFLFNTLLSIGWKAKMSGDNEVYKMVSSLSELMRATIYGDPTEKTLIDKELKNVEFYLYLQQVRFAYKIEVEIKIAEPIRKYYIPKLCLQPIVENAIVHGLESKIGKCSLSISAYEHDRDVYFEIVDNGVGFDPEMINLNDKNQAVQHPNHSNIGLVNTHKRIKILYGEPYGLTLHSKIGEGTKVIVHIPADRGEDDDIQGDDR